MGERVCSIYALDECVMLMHCLARRNIFATIPVLPMVCNQSDSLLCGVECSLCTALFLALCFLGDASALRLAGDILASSILRDAVSAGVAVGPLVNPASRVSSKAFRCF